MPCRKVCTSEKTSNSGLKCIDPRGSKHIKRFDINLTGDINIVDYTGLKEAA